MRRPWPFTGRRHARRSIDRPPVPADDELTARRSTRPLGNVRALDVERGELIDAEFSDYGPPPPPRAAIDVTDPRD